MGPFIVCPFSGFSNRLKSLISASLHDAEYKVFWQPENFCGLKYSEIFCDDSREIDYIPADSKLLATWRFELPMEFTNFLPSGFSDCSTGYRNVAFPGDVQGRTIDFEYLKIPHPILTELLKQFAQLKFSEEIISRVNTRLQKLPDHFVGVHARTWFDEPERRHKWFNLSDFITGCSCFRDKSIVVACDDPSFIDNLSKSLGKELIPISTAFQRHQKPWQQNSREEMLDDIADLLVLSHASHLVLSAMSTYSEVAWFLGGCTADISFADPLFQHKGGTAFMSSKINGENFKQRAHDVYWIQVAGNPSYHLALIPGHHEHLDHLETGVHRIGNYVEKYSGYMVASEANDYMIDVGANLGLATFPVALLQRRVVAFEPVADNVRAMKESIVRNQFDTVTLVECAIAAQVGETVIYVPLGRADNASQGEDVAIANVICTKVRHQRVLTETIDHWFTVHGKEFRPADAKLLKVDVQGYETSVFLGAENFISRCRPFAKLVIEFEFDPKLTTMAGYSIVGLLELIHSYGLEIYCNGTHIPSVSYTEFCSQSNGCDLIASFCPSENLKSYPLFYGQNFYDSQIYGSLQSAQVYLYHLFSIWGVPGSVADLGCGRGAWLATCRDLGVKRVVGFDGVWNSAELMLDSGIEFYSTDLEKPLSFTGSFDLAISLEVAEHLHPDSSTTFIESLCSLSDVVLFGAAFLGQPGTNHINNRKHSFWAEKFTKSGYVLFDLFRPIFWNDERVEPCYRQNAFLYVKPTNRLYQALVDRGYKYNTTALIIDAVHPAIYLGLLHEFDKVRHPIAVNVVQELSSPDVDKPTCTELNISRAQNFIRSNQLNDAADAYRLALIEEPNNPECLLRLSHLLLRMKCYEESFHHARHFLRIVKDVAFGYYLAGHAAWEIGRWRESHIYLLKSVELDPSHVYARVLCCMTAFTVCSDEAELLKTMNVYEDEIDRLTADMTLETAEQISNAVEAVGAHTSFFLPYLGYDVKKLQIKYGSLVCSVMRAMYHKYAHPLPLHPLRDKIKIGIVSHFFYNHSNWKIPIKGWLEQLDRQHFSIHCFHTGVTSDTITESARLMSDYFLQDSNIEVVASEIYKQQYDVLIYPGIGMDTVTLKLAALRLAPIQCASWGHPVTTGMPSIDYYLSSELMELAEGDDHYSEKLIRLPNLSIWYEPSESFRGNSFNILIPERAKNEIVFLCSQNLLKYLPQYDFIFPAIAKRVENARFIFIASSVSELTEKFMQRLELSFQSQGLTAADNVSILPYLNEADFAELNECAAIFLDSLGWSGCNTVFETLPFDTPIVTLPGSYMRGRHAYSILKMMGVEETIAGDIDDYVSIAVRLALDTQWRKDVANRIRSNKHRIYRDRKCIEGLENFLKTVSGRSHGD